MVTALQTADVAYYFGPPEDAPEGVLTTLTVVLRQCIRMMKCLVAASVSYAMVIGESTYRNGRPI
jgi:hypothetical protein